MSSVIRRLLSCAIVAAASCAQPLLAFADDSSQLQEFVVTAEKRAENVQEVPIAVTVVTGDAFTKAKPVEFSLLSREYWPSFSPSLTVTAGDQPANSAIIVRGVGTFAYSIAAEPSVLVVIDDVAVGHSGAGIPPDLVDIDRVEVLNGPQSTLFGKSASAGLVNVTTKAPTDTFTYYGDVMATNDDEERVALSLSGPISDTLSFRVSGSMRYWGGNVNNFNSGGKIDSDQIGAVRGKLQWRPNENLLATFTLHYSDDHAECCGVSLSYLGPGALLICRKSGTATVGGDHCRCQSGPIE